MSSNPSSFLDSTSNSPATRRRRAQIACKNCRKRKIKCVTNEEPPHNPCERCRRKGLTCEYVAVGEPSPPSTPASEHPSNIITHDNPAYPYGAGGSTFSPYGGAYANSSQLPTGYPGYSSVGQSSTPHQHSRFPSESQSPWNVAGTNSALSDQAVNMSTRSYYPPNMYTPSNPNPLHWPDTHDRIHPRVPNIYDNRLQYYPNMPASNVQQNISYGSQSYEPANS
ncbi:hypothetical protein D9757_000110 [Collybiopsis confluens]|uniref:Zn(2)-C6 fungal-type domain-containing protein n=1 Tax=Collybiopsis confluens TaxID=2823264 RepID=A0A8H5I1Y3_9AGAR|nr:hypothetical protein D9757_000110 [Collybiopsis confluens]